MLHTVLQPIDAGDPSNTVDYINAVEQMHNTAREIVQQLSSYDALLTH